MFNAYVSGRRMMVVVVAWMARVRRPRMPGMCPGVLSRMSRMPRGQLMHIGTAGMGNARVTAGPADARSRWGIWPWVRGADL